MKASKADTQHGDGIAALLRRMPLVNRELTIQKADCFAGLKDEVRQVQELALTKQH